MKRKIAISLIILLIPFILIASSHKKRQLRAVWITTLLNLDWPSKSGLSKEIQKKEFIDMLDSFHKNNINTVIVQIRPSGDAIYPSNFALWSKWLSGEQGIAPNGKYDPLKFMIEECHKRCMEFHAWMNPYRVVFSYENNPVSNKHISIKKPGWIITHEKHKYLNPGIPEVNEYINKLVCEVVDNYDIDAIHFDDYFYPQDSKTSIFPDSLSFNKYKGRFDNIKDWRRNNINVFIKEVGENIHKRNSHVKFGISPFPVWRNISQDAEKGVDLKTSSSYDDLCADILLWANKGWIDYVMPQLYGNIGNKYLDYSILLEWWDTYCKDINIYIGQALYKLDADSKYEEWKSADQIIHQLDLNTKYNTVKGHAFFRAKFFTNNPLSINDSLCHSYHKYPSILPINDNMPEIIPKKLNFVFLKKENKKNTLSWTSHCSNNNYFIIYKYKGLFPNYSAHNIYKISKYLRIDIPKELLEKGYKFCVSSVSRSHHESRPTKAYILKT
jgi:uncharacterized lipoprotein YddW (UPF0748 family)